MRKLFFYGGLTLVGYAFYNYFKKQYSLAMNYAYRLKKVQVLDINKDGASLDCTVEISDKSSFEIEIKGYDLTFLYEGVAFANTSSTDSFIVSPDSEFLVNAKGFIDFKNAKGVLLPAIQNILQRKPINIQVNGTLRVSFLNINRTINFDNTSFTYSEDLIADAGLGKKYDKTKDKVNKLLGKIGVKV